jgi:hypothetical protein
LKNSRKKRFDGCRARAGGVRQNRKSFLVLFFKKELLS